MSGLHYIVEPEQEITLKLSHEGVGSFPAVTVPGAFALCVEVS